MTYPANFIMPPWLRDRAYCYVLKTGHKFYNHITSFVNLPVYSKPSVKGIWWVKNWFKSNAKTKSKIKTKRKKTDLSFLSEIYILVLPYERQMNKQGIFI